MGGIGSVYGWCWKCSWVVLQLVGLGLYCKCGIVNVNSVY